MKKVLTAALICAASSFAAWDYFPVIEYGKGEAKVSFTQGRQGNSSAPGEEHDFKIRYSPIQNLELLSKLGYTFGARYQFVKVLSAGVDIGLPIPNTNWSFTPNAQFSMPLSDALVLGSNVGASFYTKEANKNAPGTDLTAGAELDLIMGKSLVWLSSTLNTGLTNRKDSSGNKIKPKDDKRGLEIVPALGYVACLGNLSLGTNVALAFGKDHGHDNFNTLVGLDFSVKF